jgi:hypothetical protein
MIVAPPLLRQTPIADPIPSSPSDYDNFVTYTHRAAGRRVQFSLLELFRNRIAQRHQVTATATQRQLQLLGPQAESEQGIVAINADPAVQML